MVARGDAAAASSGVAARIARGTAAAARNTATGRGMAARGDAGEARARIRVCQNNGVRLSVKTE